MLLAPTGVHHPHTKKRGGDFKVIKVNKGSSSYIKTTRMSIFKKRDYHPLVSSKRDGSDCAVWLGSGYVLQMIIPKGLVDSCGVGCEGRVQDDFKGFHQRG